MAGISQGHGERSEAFQGSTLTFVTGFGTGADWVPVEFLDSLPHMSSCSLCGIVPNRTVLLECSHAFCDVCYEGILRKGRKCPLDQKRFQEERARKLTLETFQVMHLKTRCCNSSRGCGFTGYVQETVDHCVKQCAFHAVTCRKCGEEVGRKNLVYHSTVSCKGVSSCGRPPSEDAVRRAARVQSHLDVLQQSCTSFQDCINRSTESIRAMFRELKAGRMLEELHHLTDEMTSMSAVLKRLEEVRVALREEVQGVIWNPQKGNGPRLQPFGVYRACTQEELAVVSPQVQSGPDSVHVHICGLPKHKDEVSKCTSGTGKRDSHIFVVSGYTCYIVTNIVSTDLMHLDFFLVVRRGSEDKGLPWPIEGSQSLTLLHPEVETWSVKMLFLSGSYPEKAVGCNGWPIVPDSYCIGTLSDVYLSSLVTAGYIRDGTMCAIVAFH